MSDEDRANPIPSIVRKMINKPPVMAGEDHADYKELVQIVRQEVKPQHLQEWLLMMDIVEAEWVLVRLRDVKVGMLHAAIPDVLNTQISRAGGQLPKDPTLQPVGVLRKHLYGMLAGDETAGKNLERVLVEHYISWDVLTGASFEATIVPQLHTDRMAVAARERRNAAYADLERLRAKRANFAGAQPERISGDVDMLEEEEGPPTAPGNGAAPATRGR